MKATATAQKDMDHGGELTPPRISKIKMPLPALKRRKKNFTETMMNYKMKGMVK